MAAMRNLLRSCAAALALLSTAAHAFSSDDSYGPTSYGVNDCGKETLHTHIGAAGGTFECCSEWGADQATGYTALVSAHETKPWGLPSAWLSGPVDIELHFHD